MVPDTTLQAFGATKLTHVLHCCPLFGVVWYWTELGSTLSSSARAAVLARTVPAKMVNPPRNRARREAFVSSLIKILLLRQPEMGPKRNFGSSPAPNAKQFG